MLVRDTWLEEEALSYQILGALMNKAKQKSPWPRQATDHETRIAECHHVFFFQTKIESVICIDDLQNIGIFVSD